MILVTGGMEGTDFWVQTMALLPISLVTLGLSFLTWKMRGERERESEATDVRETL